MTNRQYRIELTPMRPTSEIADLDHNLVEVLRERDPSGWFDETDLDFLNSLYAITLSGIDTKIDYIIGKIQAGCNVKINYEVENEA